MMKSERESTIACLRESLIPIDSESSALFDECLAGWPVGEGTLWYPSAGNDYRDILEFSHSQRNIHHLPIQPWLFVHTSVGGRGFANGPQFEDEYTSVQTLRRGKFRLAESVAWGVGLNDAWEHYRDGVRAHGVGRAVDYSGSCRAWLSQVLVKSNQVGEVRAWVLEIEQSNYDFFARFVVQGGLRFSTLVQVRQGCGLGGCTRSTAELTPWLAWAGCRQMICDGEFHAPEGFDQVVSVFREAGAPLDPPSFTVEHRTDSFRWSGFEVAAAVIHPGERNRVSEAAMMDACRSLTHPNSAWYRPQ